MMTIWLLHAIAGLLTALLLFIRQRYAVAGTSPAKRRTFEAFPCSCGDTSLMIIPKLSEDCVECARTCCEKSGRPKYKRDPDISVDNENIGQHPHDYKL